MKTKVVAAFLLALSNLIAVCAQQQPKTPQEPIETIRVGTTAVQMDLVVTDKSGRRINGLTADDFVLLDDGKQQTIDYFTAIEGSVRKTERLSPSALPGAFCARMPTTSPARTSTANVRRKRTGNSSGQIILRAS